MEVTAKAHDTEQTQASWRHEVETKAVTALSVAEINAVRDLLGKHMDTKKMEEVANEEERELGQKMQEDNSIA